MSFTSRPRVKRAIERFHWATGSASMHATIFPDYFKEQEEYRRQREEREAREAWAQNPTTDPMRN